jgi:hypothetical protein
MLRFWLDTSRPRDIDDVWGFFRVTRFDAQRNLITVAVAVDVGSGLPRLFEGRVQALVLRTVSHITGFLEPGGGGG